MRMEENIIGSISSMLTAACCLLELFMALRKLHNVRCIEGQRIAGDVPDLLLLGTCQHDVH